MKPVNDRPWVRLFLAISLRAIRRIHFEYGVWGFGRQFLMKDPLIPLINMGPGIELADERAVCAAIAQEFISSPALQGYWVVGDTKEQRRFEIDRETSYEIDRAKKADFFIKKIRDEKGTIENLPSIVEAKRARLWRPDFENGIANPSRDNQKASVTADIAKLRDEFKHRREKKIDAVLGHILVWGIYEESKPYSDAPLDFFSDLDDKLISTPMFRWLPVEWSDPNEKPWKIQVTRAIWVALSEVSEV